MTGAEGAAASSTEKAGPQRLLHDSFAATRRGCQRHAVRFANVLSCGVGEMDGLRGSNRIKTGRLLFAATGAVGIASIQMHCNGADAEASFPKPVFSFGCTKSLALI